MVGVIKQATSGWMHFWATWDLRLAILFSLFLQIFLIFSAPLRKRMSKGYVLVPLWFAYLLADATAIFAAGLVVKGQGDTSGPFVNPDLMAFWAAFLLVHLGGPDNITAFALEDNELWQRHLLSLGFPCWAVVYSSFQSFPKSELRAATLLIFIVGLIKYTERTRCLYLASSRGLKKSLLLPPNAGPGYAKLVDEYTKNPTMTKKLPISTRREKSPTRDERCELSDLEVVHVAHNLLTVSLLPLVADLMLSSDNRNQRRDFFLKRSPRDAFKVVEVELNFLYDKLYTKAAVVFGMFGFLLRIIVIIMNFSSLALFYFMEKRKFKTFDIRITYTLLLGAVALDLISLLKALNSDWIVVRLTESDHPNSSIPILRKVLFVEKRRWSISMPREKRRWFPLENIIRRRWSECVSQFNLLDYCLHPRSKGWEATVGIFGLTNMLDAMKYVKTVEFTDDLRDRIYMELKMKSELADDLETVKEMFSARGDWALRFESHTEFLRWTIEVEFDKSILLWHIATELCFNTDDSGGREYIKDISKLLSDYMLYLLILESSMITTLIGIGETRFIDTCAEAKDFFHERELGRAEESNDYCQNIFTFDKCCFHKKCCYKGGKDLDRVKRLACESILAVDTPVDPDIVMGDISKSVLFSASTLAKELKKIARPTMWELISSVWVELLSHAAFSCRPRTHAEQLGKGGQLMTFVWLLMAHLGLGNKFLISDQRHASAEVKHRRHRVMREEALARAEVERDMEESEVHARAEIEPDIEAS